MDGRGFVSSSMREGDETMEEVAEEYLNELVSRCMIQVGKRGHTGRVKTCRMHDLVRDLCVSKAKEEGFTHSIKLGGRDNIDGTSVNCRRLCVSFVGTCYEFDKSDLSSIQDNFPEVRSICFHMDDKEHDGRYVRYQCEVVKLVAKKMKSVRVLEVTNTDWLSGSKSCRGKLRDLIHLRFVRLEACVIPTSLGYLRCLQTLNLKFCVNCVKLRDSLWRMEQLRHLYLPYDGVCKSSKQRVGNFPNLQTPVNFPPDKFDLQQNLVKFSAVRKLATLQRSEEIGEIIRRHRILFNRLQSLFFTFDPAKYVHFEAITKASPCLYRLHVKGPIEFLATSDYIRPSNLTKLILGYSKLDESPIGPLAKLHSLKVLILHHDAFMGKEMVFQKNDFPQLRHLKLESLRELEAWSVHEGALPSLFCLEIENCRKLGSVPDGSRFLKQLKELKVKDMPCSFRKRVQQGGGDWDTVCHVPSVFFSNCDLELEEMKDDYILGDEVEAE